MQPEIACGPEVREQKHLMLDRAISDLQEVRTHADKVLLAINGGQKQLGDKLCADKPPQATLQSVLDEGPRRINSIAGEVHEILEHIESALF